MKYFFSVLALASILILGCSKGDKGPTGPQGSPAPNTIQTNLQNGVFPTASYSGESDTWLASAAPTVSQYSSSYRRVLVGSTISNDPGNNYSRVLLKFDVSSIPVNATLETATILLTTTASSNLGSSSVTIGIHELASSLYPSCSWNTNATWDFYNGGSAWSVCDGDSTFGDQAMINPTTLSTVVFNTSFTGTSKVVEYKIPTSVIQAWMGGTNDGLVLVSQGEFANVSTANVDFCSYNDSTPTNRPELIITYQ